MKLTLLLLSGLFMTCTFTPVMAQNNQSDQSDQSDQKEEEEEPLDESRQNVISNYPFGFIGSSLVTGYERYLGKDKSIKAIGALASAERSNFYGVDDMFELYGEIQFRFYIVSQDRVMNGLYTAPYLLYKHMQFSNVRTEFDPLTGIERTITRENNMSAGSVGYLIGYQAITDINLSIDLYLGGGIMLLDGNGDELNQPEIFNPYRSGIWPQIGANIGINF